jgi:CHASE3 domain sensor protein/CheY-like chemotaxis protein
MKRSYFLLILCGFLVALVTGLLSFASLRRVIQATETKDLALNYQKNLIELLSDLKDAETGQRGYIITGKENFLEPYQEALSIINSHLKRIEKNAQDLDQKDSIFKELNLLIQLKFQESAAQIKMRQEQGFDAASQLLRQEKGKRQMDSIRIITAQMLGNASLIIDKKDEEISRLKNYASFMNALSGLTAFLLIGLYSYLFYRDSSNLVKTKFELNQTLELYQAILENFRQILITTDKNGLITSFSKGAEKSLGYKVDDVINKKSILSLYDLQSVKNKANEISYRNQASLSDFDIIVASTHSLIWADSDWLIKRKNGSLLACKQFVSSLRNEKNEVQGYLFNWQDLSEQKQWDQELKTAKNIAETLKLDKEQFLSILTHELQVPLNTITSLAQLLTKNKMGNLKKQDLNYINRIIEGCQTLNQSLIQAMTTVSQEPLASPLESAGQIFNSPSPSLTILVVDNDPKFRQILKIYFKQLECFVLTAETGEKALELVKENAIDLITLDVMMSPMNGYEFANELHKDENLKSIPLVVISLVDKEVQKNLPGSIAFLTKPVNLSDIENILHLVRVNKDT